MQTRARMTLTDGALDIVACICLRLDESSHSLRLLLVDRLSCALRLSLYIVCVVTAPMEPALLHSFSFCFRWHVLIGGPRGYPVTCADRERSVVRPISFLIDHLEREA